MQKKTLFFAGVLLCLLILATAFYFYQKPRAGLQNVKPEYTITAKELYSVFQQNELKANRQFLEKVVRVKGIVDNVQVTDSTVNILLSGDGMGGINCSIAKDNSMQQALPAKGTVASIKGRCIGFLMDVSLVDAVIER